MRCTLKTTVTVHLELTPAEADWLQAVMQNPLNAKDETTEQRFMREQLFNALRNANREEPLP